MKIDGLLLALLLAASARGARAQEVVAVLASSQRAQQETFDGFQAAFGKPVPVLPMGAALPAAAKVVLAFGGKAAMQRYPDRVTVVYAVAPGALIARGSHDGPSIKIMMEPEAAALLERLKSLQPGLKRLAVLWTSAPHVGSAARLVKAGAARGVAVTAERLEDGDALPSRLRALKSGIDAIWLPPDPLLINARNFEILKRFSYDNDVPFYVPTEGLAEQGATAAVSVSYKEMGRMMAEAAKSAQKGRASPAELYTGLVRVAVNRAAAAEAGLTVPAKAIGAANLVLP
ncbi:MAG: hypothetical protein HYV14_00445 [Elusimicrobia bacterium]|nr:hypothetical protein [Elusimicrobiota bacterium]